MIKESEHHTVTAPEQHPLPSESVDLVIVDRRPRHSNVQHAKSPPPPPPPPVLHHCTRKVLQHRDRDGLRSHRVERLHRQRPDWFLPHSITVKTLLCRFAPGTCALEGIPGPVVIMCRRPKHFNV
jgi:hypothetical protein